MNAPLQQGLPALPKPCSAAAALGLDNMHNTDALIAYALAAKAMPGQEDAIRQTAKDAAITFASLPELGADFEGGTFQGVTTLPDGSHVAVVYLGYADEDRDHDGRVAWAIERGGVLASRVVMNLLIATLSTELPPNWYYGTSDLYGSSSAWFCFSNGDQYVDYRSAEGSAVAVRLIPLGA